MGVPLRRRSRTSKQMCHPAAPIEMKRRSMLVHSVRRVPPSWASSSHRISLPPQPYSSTLGASARVTFVSVTCGPGAPTVVSFTVFPTVPRLPIGLKGRPLVQMGRLPDFFRRVAQFSDENERPLVSGGDGAVRPPWVLRNRTRAALAGALTAYEADARSLPPTVAMRRGGSISAPVRLRGCTVSSTYAPISFFACSTISSISDWYSFSNLSLAASKRITSTGCVFEALTRPQPSANGTRTPSTSTT